MLIAFLLLCWPAWAGESVPCTGRAVTTIDGKSSGLDDCELDRIFAGDRLRGLVLPCAHLARRRMQTAFGELEFTFRLYPGGGLSHLVVLRTNFTDDTVTRCFVQSMKQRFAGPSSGEAAWMEGRFVIPAQQTENFSVTVSSWLHSGEPLPSTKLPGRFALVDGQRTASCPVGSANLVMRIGANKGQPARSATEAEISTVAGCEEVLYQDSAERSRSQWRKERKKACSCLTRLLAHPNPSLRALAAEKIAAGHYWRGRRALTAAIRQMMKAPDCTEKNCPLLPPAGAGEGHAVIEMLMAQLRLRRFVPKDVIEAMARHPSRVVRLRLVREILSQVHARLDEVARQLEADSDPVVRMMTANLGCQRAERDSIKTFLHELTNPDPAARVAAMLYAGSCVRRSAREVRKAVDQEADLKVALLMLYSLPAPAEVLVRARAIQGALHACPLVRMIAGRLLARIRKRPMEKLRQAQARESDPLLTKLWTALLTDQDPINGHHSFQIWLQWD